MIRRAASEEPVPNPQHIVTNTCRIKAIFAEICCATKAEIFWVSSQNIFCFPAFCFAHLHLSLIIPIVNYAFFMNDARNNVSKLKTDIDGKSSYQVVIKLYDNSVNYVFFNILFFIILDIISILPD